MECKYITNFLNMAADLSVDPQYFANSLYDSGGSLCFDGNQFVEATDLLMIIQFIQIANKSKIYESAENLADMCSENNLLLSQDLINDLEHGDYFNSEGQIEKKYKKANSNKANNDKKSKKNKSKKKTKKDKRNKRSVVNSEESTNDSKENPSNESEIEEVFTGTVHDNNSGDLFDTPENIGNNIFGITKQIYKTETKQPNDQKHIVIKQMLFNNAIVTDIHIEEYK